MPASSHPSAPIAKIVLPIFGNVDGAGQLEDGLLADPLEGGLEIGNVVGVGAEGAVRQEEREAVAFAIPGPVAQGVVARQPPLRERAQRSAHPPAILTVWRVEDPVAVTWRDRHLPIEGYDDVRAEQPMVV